MNGLLIDDGMKAPPEAPWNAAFRGLCAEDIHPLLADEPGGERLDGHRFGANEAARSRTVAIEIDQTHYTHGLQPGMQRNEAWLESK